jgi:penicillin-binding protein 1A
MRSIGIRKSREMSTAPPRLPQLDLGRYSALEKPAAVARFLPAAWRVIRQKGLQPAYTYHFADRREGPMGISAGDVCYLASEDDMGLMNRVLVALEDRRFYSHPGVDLWGVLRALKSNLLARRVVQGGSTITQQLVRNTLLTPNRSLARKILELALALLLERYYSKREILALYSQFVYLGPGVRGFEAASRIIYRRPLSHLDSTALFGLAGLLRRPTRDYPLTTQHRFRQRQAFVARCMAGITNADRESGGAPKDPPGIPNPIGVRGFERPRWTRVTQQLVATGGGQLTGIKRVGLTIDRVLQGHLDRILRRASEDPAVERVAAVVLRNDNADVVAESTWANGVDCDDSPAFAGALQPGSTFKPFAVLAALEDGVTADLTLLSAPFASSFIENADGSPWRVRNYAFRYRGEVTLTEALRLSDNTAFAQLTEYVSPATLQAVYERFRLVKPGRATPAITLGGVEDGVSLTQIASAYSAVARNGVYLEPRFLRFIHYADGTTWWAAPPLAGGLVVAGYSAIRRLQGVLAAALPSLRPLGFSGKTGTTRRGSLVAAYNDFVSATIWLGYKRPRGEAPPKGWNAFKVLERFIAESLLGHARDPFSI